MQSKSNSVFVRHLECPKCGSSDANSLFTDGHTYCYACEAYTPSDKVQATQASPKPQQPVVGLSRGLPEAIPDRGITRATVESYNVTMEGGNHYYPYHDKKGRVIAHKIRHVQDKAFKSQGNIQDAVLFGQNIFPQGGKYITLVEGELDALAAYQLMGSKWPVVSIKNGAKSALKDCKAQFEYLDSFESIVIAFDADEPGQQAASEVAELFGNKAKIMKHANGYKDACEYSADSAAQDWNNAWWRAEVYVPDGIINAKELLESVLKPIEQAKLGYPWAGLNELTMGIREAELITITAGSGLGKSQFMREIVYHLLKSSEGNLGLMFLEESAERTARSIMSMHANKPLHLPTTEATEDEIIEAYENTLGTGRVYLFDHFGSTGIDNILNRVRYMARALDCRIIFLDHVSIVVSAQEGITDERKAIDEIMTKLRMMVQETGITLFCVSHLRRPDGKGFEEGAVTSLSALRGSHSIAQLSDIVIGLERNGQAEDMSERHTTKVRVLKNRFCGITGPACGLYYDQITGRMTEVRVEL